MMYVGYPKLTPAERLEHLPPLRSTLRWNLPQALQAAGLQGPLQELRLAPGQWWPPRVCGHPRYRPRARQQGRTAVQDSAGGHRCHHRRADPQRISRPRAGIRPRRFLITWQRLGSRRTIPSTWAWWAKTRSPIPGRWTCTAPCTPWPWVMQRTPWCMSPSATGEVVRDATRTERLWNYAGAWIHWLYPFRGNVFDRYWTGHRELAVHRWRRAGAHGHRGGRAALALHGGTLQKRLTLALPQRHDDRHTPRGCCRGGHHHLGVQRADVDEPLEAV